MKYPSVFDIIGPVMIGPSSSHTAGAIRIGQIARKIFGQMPTKITISFYRSFAETYKGHATDVAVIGGILNFETDDIRVRDSLLIAKENNIEISFIIKDEYTDHPNTLIVEMENDSDKIKVTGVSIGGGSVKIIMLNNYNLNLSGEGPTLLVFHKDVYGAVASVTKILADSKVNISYMEVSRIEKDSEALMLIETDQEIKNETIINIEKQEICNKIILID